MYNPRIRYVIVLVVVLLLLASLEGVARQWGLNFLWPRPPPLPPFVPLPAFVPFVPLPPTAQQIDDARRADLMDQLHDVGNISHGLENATYSLQDMAAELDHRERMAQHDARMRAWEESMVIKYGADWRVSLNLPKGGGGD